MNLDFIDSDPQGKFLLREMLKEPRIASPPGVDSNLGFAFGSHIGQIRKRNEDRLALALINSKSTAYFCAIVCDGVGGSEMGDMASSITTALFVDRLMKLSSRAPLIREIDHLIRGIDDFVRNSLEGRGASTLSAFVLSSDRDFVAINIGDSRLYNWSVEKKLIQQVSVDDTLENEFKKLHLKNLDVLKKRGLRGRLSQAIGEPGRDSADLKINTYGKDSFSGILLASDGAWAGDEGGFDAIARHSENPAELVRRVLAFSSWTGGLDNVSVIAIENLDLLFSNLSELRGKGEEDRGSEIWCGGGRLILPYMEKSYRTAKLAGEAVKDKNKKESVKKEQSGRSKASKVDKSNKDLQFKLSINEGGKKKSEKLEFYKDYDAGKPGGNDD